MSSRKAKRLARSPSRPGKPGTSRTTAPAGNARERARVAEIAARRRQERRTLAVVAIALVLVLVGGGIGIQAYRSSRAPVATTLPAGAGFAPVTITDGKPIVLGQAAAPVTLTLYEDFHCPHCAEFEELMGPRITELQNAGTVKVELYPMAFIDQGSFAASNAMACAAESGLGQPFYLGLFANHTRQWSADQLVALGTQTDAGHADSAFATCVRDDAHQGWVNSINSAADTNGVSQTPTAFLNGDPVDIASLTPDRLTELVDQARQK
ncbi:MAG: thioredoxin domain-containing protein [Propionibacteriaceae bacterium]